MLAGVRLLLVEDDEDTRELLAAALEARHARVRTAATGAAAISIAASWCPDVLLIDLVLPDLDGMTVLGAIRAGATPCAAPAIAISGKASSNDRAASLRGGFSKHLVKPARVTDIVSAVHEVRARPQDGPASVLRAAVEELNARSDCQFTSILRFVDNKTLSSVWTFDRDAPDVDPFPIGLPIEASYCVLVRDTGAPCVISDAASDPRVVSHPKRASLARYIGVPLWTATGEMFGTLCSYDPAPAAVPPAVIEVHAEVAAAISGALDEAFGAAAGIRTPAR